MVAMIAVFYFLIIRPENKRKKQAEQMRSSLKKGDRVTTIGGMVGKIVQVNDSTIVFETSEDRVRIEVTKWAVQSTGAMEQAAAQKSGKKADKVEEKAEETPAVEEKATETVEAPTAEEKPSSRSPRSSKSYPDAPAVWPALFCTLFSEGLDIKCSLAAYAL